ncbi:hypothetical protein M0534_01000 [Methylonatrum kenyense]|uniref:hypothetical protein n=1 Tax=Methylonatrum kenyense TaxID=455253 RepID=UPI0020C001B3|nr:hypothetical protein [Methylonatrum kenyense]MCK8514908.1 hypothetical protein [Methylonatrum kenyense]
MAQAPCDDVLTRSRQLDDQEQALSLLGRCLASRTSQEMHLRVVAEMAARSLQAGDERAYCRFGKLLEAKLEKAADEAMPTALQGGREARSEIACNCDRFLVDARAAGLDLLTDEFDPLWRPRWQPEVPVRTVHDSVEVIGDQEYRMLVSQQSGTDRYCVFVNEDLRYAESRPALSDGFLESSLFTHQDSQRTHAVVRWLRGDRGETLQIIDLERGQVVRNTASADPVHYDITDGRVSYRYTDSDSDGAPSPETSEGHF